MKMVVLAGCAETARGMADGGVAVHGPAMGGEDRAYWCSIAVRLGQPVLEALVRRRFKIVFPVEQHAGDHGRERYTHLEAFARLLAGVAPWLELGADGSAEGILRGRIAGLAREAIDAATDPGSSDYMNFSQGRQPLVDCGFFAQALLRAPGALWSPLSEKVRAQVVAALRASRVIVPGGNNWQLFASEIEAFFTRVGAARDNERLFRGLRDFARWYLGDGVYGDGPDFHWDSYNAFVIQPMLLECLEAVAKEGGDWTKFLAEQRRRLSRYAQIQERLIAPDGSYPVIGRSVTYRCGAFQGLALASLRRLLPTEVSPPQARVALTRVIRRTLEPSECWDASGWLTIGLSGHQPALGEDYISTGSLYLCAQALLPLGLPSDDAFWAGPAVQTTWEKAWDSGNIRADHALRDRAP